MREFFSTYWLYIKTFFKARVEYRTSFFLGLLSNFYCYFVTYISFWVLTQGTGNIANWDFSDLSILYGLSLITYAISGTLLWYTVFHLEEMIVSGQLDIMLIRPTGLIRQMIFQRFGDTFLGQIIVTIIFLVGAFFIKGQEVTIQKIIFLLLAVIGGVLLQMGSMILFGSFTFWTMRSKELIDIVYYGLRDMTKYPLLIYPKAIQYLLTFIVPWAFINYYPAVIITNKVTNQMELVLGCLSPIIGVVWFSISIIVFKCGLKRYTSAGS